MSWYIDAEYSGAASAWMSDVFEETIKEKTRRYIDPLAEKLKLDDDKANWEPSPEVQRWLPRGRVQDVKRLSDQGVLLKDVAREMANNKDVGIVVLGPQVSRNANPYAIAIVLDHVIYIANPKIGSKDMTFLCQKFKENIQFWTTNGLQESDCLYHLLKVDLTTINAACASGMHIQLMESIKKKAQPISFSYTPKAYEKSRQKDVYIESYEELVETWLGVPKGDIHFEKSRMSHLITEPLDLAAINIVKKRCCLVLSLCRQLRKFQNQEFNQMNQSVCRRLVSLDKNLCADVMRYMEKRSKQRDSDDDHDDDSGDHNDGNGSVNARASANVNNNNSNTSRFSNIGSRGVSSGNDSSHISSIMKARYVDYARYIPLSLGLPSRRINK